MADTERCYFLNQVTAEDAGALTVVEFVLFSGETYKQFALAAAEQFGARSSSSEL